MTEELRIVGLLGEPQKLHENKYQFDVELNRWPEEGEEYEIVKVLSPFQALVVPHEENDPPCITIIAAQQKFGIAKNRLESAVKSVNQTSRSLAGRSEEEVVGDELRKLFGGGND